MEKCRDCQKDIEVKEENGETIISGGLFLEYKVGEKPTDKVGIFKCNECYEKDPSLTNYQDTECYSRIVGYMRPVQQWHPGKVQEFEDRVTFSSTFEGLLDNSPTDCDHC